jgi:hypothetical protein
MESKLTNAVNAPTPATRPPPKKSASLACTVVLRSSLAPALGRSNTKYVGMINEEGIWRISVVWSWGEVAGGWLERWGERWGER